jgi:hypothetical protein
MLGTSSSTTNPSVQPIPILNPLISMTPTNNFMIDDRLFRYDNYPSFMDSAMPLISPINLNPNTKLYPTSTRNYFNIDILHDTNYLPMTIQGYNIFRPYTSSANNFITTPTGQNEKINYNQPFTPNKEVSMANKILITNNEVEEVDKIERTLTPSFKPIDREEKNKEMGGRDENLDTSKKKLKRPSLDLNLVNTSETGNIFSASVSDRFMTTGKATQTADIIMEIQAPIQTPIPKEERISHTISSEKEEEGSVTNISDKSGQALLEHKFSHTPKSSNNNMNKSPIVTPRSNINPNANLTVSPKSAFVKMIKK